MNTSTLPGWLQVVLVWLVGVVGWLLLRPYRRITQLGGKDHTRNLVRRLAGIGGSSAMPAPPRASTSPRKSWRPDVHRYGGSWNHERCGRKGVPKTRR